MRKAVFLDRDGVINEMVPSPEGPDSPRSVDEFRLLPGAGTAIKSLNDLGLPVVIVSNQPGIAKGKLCADDLDAMTELMRNKLRETLAVIDGVYYCLHHPQAVNAEYRVVCDCRKPKPGLLTRAGLEMDLALAGSYMVGDRPTDIRAGKSVGCTTLFVASGTTDDAEADYACDDLVAAARLIAHLEGSRVAIHSQEDPFGDFRRHR
jgi:D-glycero-D-manno-heptose 1,7-bisphosphate phosphatase